ncbi:MAG TPA: phosphatase PAP2 family protein [Acidimicrobiales bacterium]|nr:phosphatase PAP2 family protein [Acidimicrobiales bacterium]
MHTLIKVVGEYFVFLSIAIVVVYWLRAKMSVKVSLTWQLVVGGVLAELMSIVASHLFYDTRPFVTHHLIPIIPHAADNGFPSDHALLTSFLAFTMILYSKRTAIILFVNALLVSWARVAAHIHSPIDIVASFVFAAIAVVVVRAVTSWWRARGKSNSWRTLN